MHLLKPYKTFFLITSLIFLICPKSFGTHLVGGNLTYKYIGTFGGLERYQLHFEIYRDCYNSQTAFDNTIDVGIYYNEPSNQGLYTTVTLGPPDETSVDPPSGGANCGFKPNVCIKRGIYEQNVDLPTSSYGYNVLWLRCCRNAQINLSSNEGAAYLSTIPPTKYKNSSPQFTDVPAPYICSNDTIQLLNSATDSDGDSLVYTLAKPYTGGTSKSPIPTVASTFTAPSYAAYNSGYSYSRPFGTSGFASIDKTTGLTSLFVPSKGNYSIAFDIEEFRNGVSLGKTRRDIQLIVIDCKPGPRPKRVTSTTNSAPLGTFSYTINAGDSLNIELDYAGGDSLTISGKGELLDPSFTNHGTLISKSAKGVVSTNFRWLSNCDQTRTFPYQFSVYVVNNNCPPKYINNTFTVFVLPYKGANKIIGQDTACLGTTYIYKTNGSDGSQYDWTVTGGTFTQDKTPGNANRIVVTFKPGVSQATITAKETNIKGCKATDQAVKTIILLAPIKSNTINGPKNICPSKTYHYSVGNDRTVSDTAQYFWKVINGTIIKNNKSSIDVLWDAKVDSGIVKVQEVIPHVCKPDSVFFKVYIDRPIIDTLDGPQSVCPNSSNIEYSLIGSSKYYRRYFRDRNGGYKLFVDGGTSNGVTNPTSIMVNWGNAGKGQIKMIIYSAIAQCPSDTIRYLVNKGYHLKADPILGDSVVCEFSQNIPYNTRKINGSTYTWSAIGGIISTFGSKSKTSINWGGAGNGSVGMVETAYDSINNQPCSSDTVKYRVRINPIPNTQNISSSAITFCQATSTFFKIRGLPGSKFIWSITSGDQITNNGKDSISIFFKTAGNFKISLKEISKDSCIGNPVFLDITIHPQPKTKNLTGPSTFCLNDNIFKTYTVDGYNNSYYFWKVYGGNAQKLDTTLPSITIDWFKPGLDSIKVKERSIAGCYGVEQKLIINYDSFFAKIINVSTLKSNDKIIKIDYSSKNTQFFKGPLKIFRYIQANNIEEYADSASVFRDSVYDKTAKTSKYAYVYSLESNNICKQKIRTNQHKSVLLNGSTTSADSVIALNWNAYQGWIDSVNEYQVNVNIDNNNFDTNYVSTNYLDLTQVAPLEGNTICYRIKAIKVPSKLLNDTLVSYSNKVCFNFEPKIFIPNVFSPDANGLNDKFWISATNYKSFNLKIYNRWGEKLFESTSAKSMWDGTFNGSRCPEGVYIYILNVEGNKDNYFRSGNVSIIK
jgi:gliding motility-associated-like protein